MSNAIVRVPVETKQYDIHIGPDVLERADALLKPFLNRPKVVVVTDENVERTQGERLRAAFVHGKIDFEFIVLPAGEETKSFAQLQSLCGRLLDLGVERGDMVVAFGGGVIGDLTGFACSMVRRGCGFAQAPTSLLAQVDSAVGGKTAINAPQGKNLIGAFYQPKIVIIDSRTLETLPEREIRAGYAEIVKCALINDASYFDWLDDNVEAIISGSDVQARIEAVRKSCEAKAAIVARDERESGERALLNLGHTFGHAFEAACGYSDRLLHGEAVALGTALAFEYSAYKKMCAPRDAERVKSHLEKAGLPTRVSDIEGSRAFDPNALIELMRRDKKVAAGEITLILVSGIGAAQIVRGADGAAIRDFLADQIAG